MSRRHLKSTVDGLSEAAVKLEFLLKVDFNKIISNFIKNKSPRYTFIEEISNPNPNCKPLKLTRKSYRPINFPLMFSDRLLALEQNTYNFEKQGIGIMVSYSSQEVYDKVPEDIKKDTIEFKLNVAGWMIEKITADVCKLTYLYEGSLGGSVSLPELFFFQSSLSYVALYPFICSDSSFSC